MVAPAIIAGGISAVTSLFGASKARKQRQAELEAQRPINIRKEFEAAGLHPSLGFSGGYTRGLGYAPSFGSHIANAGQAIADGINGAQQATFQKTRLELENKRLEDLVKAKTFGNNRPGIYGGTNGSQSSVRSSNVPAPLRLPDGRAIPPVEVIPKWIDAYDENTGKTVRIVNPELTESSASEMAVGIATLGGAEIIQDAGFEVLESGAPGRKESPKPFSPDYNPEKAKAKAKAKKDEKKHAKTVGLRQSYAGTMGYARPHSRQATPQITKQPTGHPFYGFPVGNSARAN